MRIFKLILFLVLLLIAGVLDFLYIETSPGLQLSELSAAAIAAIAGGSALVSGIGSLLDSASTNSANKEINRENREWQTKENEKSRLWAEREWNRQFEKTNLYNTPSAQKTRLREAGYNPYMVNGQIAGSNTSSNPGTPSDGARGVPSSIPVQRSDYGFISQAGQQAASSYLAVKSTDANVANQTMQTERQAIDNAKELYRFTGDKKVAERYLNTELGRTRGALYNMTNSPYARQVFAEADRAQAESEYARSVADLKSAYGDKEVRAALRIQYLSGDKLKSELLSLAKDRSKSDAEIAKLVSEKIRNYAESNKIKADTETVNATRDLIIAGMTKDNSIKTSQDAMLANERAESDTRFVQRQGARRWMRSHEGQSQAEHNQVTEDNEALNRLNKITHSATLFK